MRNVALFLLAVLLCVSPAGAKDSASQSKRKLQSYLTSLASMESRAKPIEPALGNTKEVERRYDVLFQMMEKEVKPMARELSAYRNGGVDDSLALPAQSVEEAAVAFSGWLEAKMTLLNAGAKNPSLKAIQQNEKTAYNEYQNKLKAAQDSLK